MSPEVKINEREREPVQPRVNTQDIGATALQLVETEQEFELTDNRIIRLTPIYSPKEVLEKIPQSIESNQTVGNAREKVAQIIHPEATDSRLLVVIGPCSIHDPRSAVEYAGWVKEQREKYADSLEIVMRTYLEKPRTTTGWKGLINDPHLDGSFAMNEGLLIARNMLHDITKMGVPVASELLYTNTPQRVGDMMSYGAIGARTTESQLHRELASGMSFPVGFKNGTGGSIQIAADALKSASSGHAFVGIDSDGHDAIVETAGNADCHVILRGSSRGPNYDRSSVLEASIILKKAGVNPALVIDASHANSSKDYRRQYDVVENIAWQVAGGNRDIRGVMIESNLVEGVQKIGNGKNLVYGQSITDGCAGLYDSEEMLANLAGAVSTRV